MPLREYIASHPEDVPSGRRFLFRRALNRSASCWPVRLVSSALATASAGASRVVPRGWPQWAPSGRRVRARHDPPRIRRAWRVVTAVRSWEHARPAQ